MRLSNSIPRSFDFNCDSSDLDSAWQHHTFQPGRRLWTMYWLSRYGGPTHDWQASRDQGQIIYYRPLGLVESGFDIDGRHYEGRADITLNVSFEIKHSLANEDLQRRLLLSWTCLRLQHTLLLAAATSLQFSGPGATDERRRMFVVRHPRNADEALQSAGKHMIFLDDHYDTIDPQAFYIASQNSARILDPSDCLSKLFVHPLSPASPTTSNLRFTFILAHSISDGLTNATWTKTLLRLLNTSPSTLTSSTLPSLLASLRSRLSPPQEALYPRIPGSPARQRWFWAITLALRHVHRASTPCFPNPLLRPSGPAAPSIRPSRPYAAVLPYSRPPVLNSGNVTAALSPRAVRRLHALCAAARVSIGAGAFVLVAVAMMALHERREPHVPLARRRPFAGSFPVDPRAFFGVQRPVADSCMLAFSEGVVLPFLPGDLPLEGRITVLARLAQRQLERYQKRSSSSRVVAGVEVEDEDEERARLLRYWGASGPGRVIAMTYIDTMERADTKLPPHLQKGFAPSRGLPKPKGTLATCGVSSVGRGDPGLRPGQYSLDTEQAEGEEGGRFVADIRGTKMGVRPREGEFLVGVGGTEDSFGLGVSYDACAIDEDLVQAFKTEVEGMLEPNPDPARL